MNWYDTNGNGSYYPAGSRTGDGDAMNGNAVMFDAVQGLILTVGGAPNYQARGVGVQGMGRTDRLGRFQGRGRFPMAEGRVMPVIA